MTLVADPPAHAESEWAVETHGLTKRFGPQVAVNDVELLVPLGCAFGYLGPNGAGKTTLIRTLLGLTHADSGTMALLGVPVPRHRAVALARVGAIVDEPRFHGHLSGRNNLRMLAAARGAGAEERIGPALERVRLSERANDKVNGYSMGMRQRLGVAACLLGDPELLILDEPMNGLDPAGMHEMREMIENLVAEGRTIMLSSHLLDEVERTCHAVAIVDRGRVIRQGPIQELIRSANSVVRIECADPAAATSLITASRLADKTEGYDGGLAVTLPVGATRDTIAELNRRLVEGGVSVYGLQEVQASLEDWFLSVTSRLGEAPAMSTTVTAESQPATNLVADGRGSWLPTWPLIATKFLELRKRRGLMIAVLLLTLALPVLVLGLRLLFHAIDPKSYGPAGSPSVFEALCDPLAQFGFIIAAALGATAGATDLGEGMFRHLVITGRSRVALYLARVPSGLALLLPLVALGFTFMCLVTAFEGTPQPTSVNVQGVTVPLNLSEGQLHTFLLNHASEFGPVGGAVKVGPNGSVSISGGLGENGPLPQQFVRNNFSNLYQDYLDAKATDLNPAPNEMIKIGLWIELQVAIGFIVGLGLGSLTGQRTVSVIILIALQIIVTPILAMNVIPHFLDGQRLIVGVAMDQLRPAALLSTNGGHHGPGKVILGGRGSLGIPAMPTWAMITVIVGWIVGWTGLGAWRMATRDA